MPLRLFYLYIFIVYVSFVCVFRTFISLSLFFDRLPFTSLNVIIVSCLSKFLFFLLSHFFLSFLLVPFMIPRLYLFICFNFQFPAFCCWIKREEEEEEETFNDIKKNSASAKKQQRPSDQSRCQEEIWFRRRGRQFLGKFIEVGNHYRIGVPPCFLFYKCDLRTHSGNKSNNTLSCITK